MMDCKTRRVTRFLNRFLLQVINSLLLTAKRDSLLGMCRLYDNGWPNPMTHWLHTASSLPNPMTMTHSLTPVYEPACLSMQLCRNMTSWNLHFCCRPHKIAGLPFCRNSLTHAGSCHWFAQAFCDWLGSWFPSLAGSGLPLVISSSLLRIINSWSLH